MLAITPCFAGILLQRLGLLLPLEKASQLWL